MDDFLLQRRYEESPASPKDHRLATERDRDRILHSSAFRRLQGKTQIFGIGQADFYRTRLTHSLEVSQIARAIAYNLLFEQPQLEHCLSPELAEAAALAHDLGHPPFGHAGEQTLDACMREVSRKGRLKGKSLLRFEGNAQTFHILVAAEPKSPLYPGLNLTRATLAGVLKYPYAQEIGNDKFIFASDLPAAKWALEQGGAILASQARPRRRLPITSIACQILDWADDCAYSIHDVEDALQAQFLHPGDLMDFCPVLYLVVRTAAADGYAVPSFCVWNAETMVAVLSVAADLRAPVILMNGPAEFSLAAAGRHGAVVARPCPARFDVPAALHLDHGDSPATRAGVPRGRLHLGDARLFRRGRWRRTSPRCGRWCALAHPSGVTVEGEIGHVGRADTITTEGGARLHADRAGRGRRLRRRRPASTPWPSRSATPTASTPSCRTGFPAAGGDPRGRRRSRWCCTAARAPPEDRSAPGDLAGHRQGERGHGTGRRRARVACWRNGRRQESLGPAWPRRRP